MAGPRVITHLTGDHEDRSRRAEVRLLELLYEFTETEPNDCSMRQLQAIDRSWVQSLLRKDRVDKAIEESFRRVHSYLSLGYPQPTIPWSGLVDQLCSRSVQREERLEALLKLEDQLYQLVTRQSVVQVSQEQDIA